MANKSHLILMADVIDSRLQNQTTLMHSFQQIVAGVNEQQKAGVLSPLTITLGDEFQGVIKDLPTALNIIISIEEAIVKSESDFKLRYVLFEGDIETEINTQAAYGMLGSGLTLAREMLEQLKGDTFRFYINLIDKKKSRALNNIFLVLQGLVDDWNLKRDYYIVSAFFNHNDYKQVAKQLEKERSLMWKRKKTLRLDEYFAIKQVINYLGEE